MIRSLRARLMLGASILAILFMIALLPALQRAFFVTLSEVIEQRLAADVNTLITAAHIQDGKLVMPQQLPDEEFNLPEARLLGLIYDHKGTLVWHSRSASNEEITYSPRYTGGETEFVRALDGFGEELFVYDVELHMGPGEDNWYSFVTMVPTREYARTFKTYRAQLYLWLGGGFLVLLALLWLGLTWGFRSLRRLSVEMDQVESGKTTALSEKHPKELLRLTNSLNRLLESERRQRERYRDSLEDLAHSLKTPLSVLQGISEVMVGQKDNREQAYLMHAQIERMSQQIGYQLQRATLRRSGLVRHSVSLRPLLDSLCSSLDKVYRDKQVVITIDVPKHSFMAMEQGALLELLGNLLENAFRLCLHQVRITFVDSIKESVLTVEDDGPGVREDQREFIVQRGKRLDTVNPGHGIGLAVVKDIIESYDGELSVADSELGGASFTIRLPLG